MKKSFLTLAIVLSIVACTGSLSSCIDANGNFESIDNYEVDRSIDANFSYGSLNWYDAYAEKMVKPIENKLSDYKVSKTFWHDSIATNLFNTTYAKAVKEITPMLDSLVMQTGYDDFSVTVYLKKNAGMTTIQQKSISPSLKATNLVVYRTKAETNVTSSESTDLVLAYVAMTSSGNAPYVYKSEADAKAGFEAYCSQQAPAIQTMLNKVGRSDAYFDIMFVDRKSWTVKYTKRITPAQ